jgi:hypothetical protein
MTPFFLQHPEGIMGHISTLKLHQLRYGELSHAEEVKLRSHLDTCQHCAARLAAQDNHRAAFELMPIPQALQAPAVPSLWRRILQRPLLAPALLAALALLIAVPQSSLLTPDILTKGSGEIEILVEDHGVLDVGESIRPGDRIQLRIPAGDWVEVWVGDGEEWLGRFQVHSSERYQLVPFSLKVDASPGPEQLVVLLSNHPVEHHEAERARTGSDLDGIELRSLTLDKEL